MRRWGRRIVGTAAVTLAGWLASTFGFVYLSLHPVKLPIRKTPAALQRAYEDVTFSATDGVRLRGWFVPGLPGKGVLILCHGYPGNRADLLEYIGFLNRAGFGVLAFDFRALGESGGDVCTIGYREVEDALGAVAYLKTRKDTRDLPLGILGTSMGGAVALQAAARSPQIRAVVADSPYASLDRAVTQRFCRVSGSSGVALSVPARWLGDRMMGVEAASVSPLRQVSRISPRPLLLIYGTEDAVVLPEDSRILYKAAGEPKAIWRIEGARHIGGYAQEGPLYEERVISFFRKALAL